MPYPHSTLYPSSGLYPGPGSPVVVIPDNEGISDPWRTNARNIWKFELVSSIDMTAICELSKARDRVLTLGLNKAGSFSFTMNLDHKDAIKIQEASTGVVIRRDGVAIWSGVVWTVTEQTPNTLNVGCVGWLQTLEKRVSKLSWGNPLIYTRRDAGDIAQDLIRRSNADAMEGYNYIFPGSVQPSQTRDRSYAPFVNILTEINALTEIESGFDMEVHPEARRLIIWEKLQTIQADLSFDYSSNVSSVTRSSDVSRMCNRMIAYSASGAAQVDDIESQRLYGVFEEAMSLADVVDISILRAYAAAEVAVRSKPLRLATFIPRPFSSQNPRDPRIFENFNIGDIGYLTVNHGRLQLDKQAARVFGAGIGFNDNGDEAITSLQVTAT